MGFHGSELVWVSSFQRWAGQRNGVGLRGPAYTRGFPNAPAPSIWGYNWTIRIPVTSAELVTGSTTVTAAATESQTSPARFRTIRMDTCRSRSALSVTVDSAAGAHADGRH